jgi:DNA-binding protein HU-beta
LIAAVADRAELSKTDAKRALVALDEVILHALSNAQKVRIGGLVQVTVRMKLATKKRKGRNPATGRRSILPPSPPPSTCGLARSGATAVQLAPVSQRKRSTAASSVGKKWSGSSGPISL